MTLILVVRSIEGIAIVSDSVTSVTTVDASYKIYGRQKIARIGDYAVVHAGLTFINQKTINQIIGDVREQEPSSVEELCNEIRYAMEVNLLEDSDYIETLEKGFLLASLGVVGYHQGKPFVYRIVFLRSELETELIEIVESEKAFEEPYHGIDYFGDYDFVRLLIKEAKKQELLKPFDILSLYETLELGRTLMRFLIDFQQFMVKFTVAYPLESAVITHERGFEWIDKIELQEFHYDHNSTHQQ